MALLLGLVRRAPLFVRAMQKREFIRRPTRDLRGSTVGIVGFGGNGRRIAEVLAPWGVRIIATDMFPGEKPAHVAELWPAEWLHQLLPLVDVLVLCVPLNANTRGMIGAQEFNLLKPGAILINVARGKVVVESEMVAALESGRLWGAGLDVTEVEPLSEESRLWDMPNVFITPHVGAQSASRYEDATRLVCENLKRYLNGRPMLNLVDKRLGFPIPNGRLPPALGCVERYSS